MTTKPVNWQDIKPAAFGNLKPPAGGYILKVNHAGDFITPRKHQKAIKIYFDIAEGEFIDYYKKLRDNLKKDITLNYLQLTEDERALPFFKRMVNFFEECNIGFIWDFQPLSLVGKKIGAVLGEREYMNKETNQLKTILDIIYFCPISTIIEGSYNVPKKKTFDEVKKTSEEKTPDYDSFFRDL